MNSGLLKNVTYKQFPCESYVWTSFGIWITLKGWYSIKRNQPLYDDT